jgi:hypothetical protein
MADQDRVMMIDDDEEDPTFVPAPETEDLPRLMMLDEEEEEPAAPPTPEVKVVAIEVAKGEKARLVGGLPGWYAGDRMYRTSDGICEKGDDGEEAGDGPALTDSPEESACSKARRLFKLNGPYAKTPVFIPTEGGGFRKVENEFLIEFMPTGAITSLRSVKNAYVLGKPEDMDILGLFSGEVTRGGSMKDEKITWMSSGQETWTMPDGLKVQEFLSVFKDWTGAGADRLVRHQLTLECRNFVRQVLKDDKRVWRFPHTIRGQAQFNLAKKIASEMGRVQAREKVLLTAWGMTSVTEEQLLKLYTDSLAKKKDEEGNFTNELTSKSVNRLARIMDHTYHAPGASTEGGLTIWSGQQGASYDATHLFSTTNGLEGMEYGAGGRFMDEFSLNANALFLSLQKENTTEERVHQAVQLILN